MLVHLSVIENQKNISFIQFHGGLIGLYFNNETLPWDDDIDVSILHYDERPLISYLESLSELPDSALGGLQKAGFPQERDRFHLRYYDDGDFAWYHDTRPKHHIEFRLLDKKSALYTDITVLYPHVYNATLEALIAKEHPSSIPDGGFAKNVLVMKSTLASLPYGHIYNLDDVVPLNRCILNRVLTHCPHVTERTLKQEYSKFQQPFFKNFKFDDESRCWIAK